MGNTSSQDQVEPDPWWEPNESQHNSTHNVCENINPTAERLIH
jgi:hypothetical protein